MAAEGSADRAWFSDEPDQADDRAMRRPHRVRAGSRGRRVGRRPRGMVQDRTEESKRAARCERVGPGAAATSQGGEGRR